MFTRTEAEIDTFISNLDIEDIDLNLGMNAQQIRRFLDFGLVLGHGDTFSFEGKGVIVVGPSIVDKTTFVSKLQEFQPNKVHTLSDDLVIMTGPTNPESFVSRHYSLLPYKPYKRESWEEILRYHFREFSGEADYPLRVIICLGLTNGQVRFAPGNPARTIANYLMLDKIKGLRKSWEGIEKIKYSTPQWITEHETNIMCADISEKLALL